MCILTPPKPVLAGDFSKIARKGTAFCAHSQINCTKSNRLCTNSLICAIKTVLFEQLFGFSLDLNYLCSRFKK